MLDLTVQQALVERAKLRNGVLPVGERQHGELGCAALGARGKKFGKLLDQHAGRDSVEDQVMYVHQQAVIRGTKAVQAEAHERPVQEVERSCRRGAHPLSHLLLRGHILWIESYGACGDDDEPRRARRDGHHRVQHFVPFNDMGQSHLKQPEVQLAAQGEHNRGPVVRARIGELLGDPDPLLCQGKGETPVNAAVLAVLRLHRRVLGSRH